MRIETSLSRKIAIGFSLALLLSILLGAFSCLTTVQFVRSAEVVARTHRSLALLQALLGDVVSAESEARGYIITGQEPFLEPVRSALNDVETDLKALRASVSDPLIIERLNLLEKLSRERISRLNLTVEMRRLKGFEAVREASGPGKKLMDDVREVASSIEEREKELLAERDEASRALAWRTIAVVIGSGILAVVVTTAGVCILAADIAHRERLEKEVLAISEREQRRIGQDIHDGICQQLTGISLLSRSLEQRLQGVDAAEASQVTRLINDCIEQARLVTRGLHPVPDEPMGLLLALRELADNVRALTGVDCRLECPEPVPVPDQTTATNLYRIAQEAVQNALRHAGAKTILVGLSMDAGAVILTVGDDGGGLPKVRSGKGLGLEIMKYRANNLRARLEVSAGDYGVGTKVTCTLPPV